MLKRKRKQIVILDGKRWLIDVPEDDILYRLDCRAEYLRSRSLRLETSLDSVYTRGRGCDRMELS